MRPTPLVLRQMAKPINRPPVPVSSVGATGSRSSQSDASEPRFGWQLLLLCLCGLFLRIWHLIQTAAVPTSYSLSGDSAGYFEWAQRIAAGDWLGDLPFYQAPLYPYVLAILMKAFGAEIVGIRFVQAFFGAVSIGLIGLATRPLFGSTVALLAALILAVYPPAIFYDGIIQKTSLASLLLCGLLAVLTRLDRRPQWLYSLSAGLLLGLLTLTRENALLWTPLPLLWIGLGLNGLKPRRRVWLAASYGCGLWLALFPVAARNAYVGGEWSATTFQSGPNFYIGNHLDANGLYQPLVPGHETPMYERADAQRLAEQAEGRSLTSREVSRFWMNLALDEIRSAPGHWAGLMATKVLMVINRYEVPDVESMQVYRQFSPPLQALAMIGHFGLLGPLAVMGIAQSWQDRRQLWLFYLLSLSMVAAVAMFFILGRYRYPLVPLLTPFAAYALHAGWKAIRLRQTQGLKWPLAIGFLVGGLCNLPIHDRVTLEASSLMNQGAAAGQAGNLEASIRWIGAAISLQPEMPEAHFNLGRALSLSGRYAEAVAAFREAQRQSPELVMVDYQLGDALEKLGDRAVALIHYRRAAQRDPQDPRAAAAVRRLTDQLNQNG